MTVNTTPALSTRCTAGAILEQFVYTFRDAAGTAIDLGDKAGQITWRRHSTGETGEITPTATNSPTGAVTWLVPAALTATADTIDMVVWAGSTGQRLDGQRWRLIVSGPVGTPTV